MDRHETFWTKEEALECKSQHFGAEITEKPGNPVILGGEQVYPIPEDRSSWTVWWPELRGVNDIPNLTKATLDDGTVGYFFGDTTIRAWETMENGKYRLKPVAGDQIACGEWYDLDLDQVARYCSLIEMYLNGKEEA